MKWKLVILSALALQAGAPIQINVGAYGGGTWIMKAHFTGKGGASAKGFTLPVLDSQIGYKFNSKWAVGFNVVGMLDLAKVEVTEADGSKIKTATSFPILVGGYVMYSYGAFCLTGSLNLAFRSVKGGEYDAKGKLVGESEREWQVGVSPVAKFGYRYSELMTFALIIGYIYQFSDCHVDFTHTTFAAAGVTLAVK